MSPRFSIILPAYNSEDFLPKALQCLQGQSFSDWEAIVVVDGSPDQTATIAHQYAENDRRIRVIEKLVNQGTHLARKTGVAVASGKYTLFFDPDDELPADTLENLLPHLPEAGGVFHFGTEVICDEATQHLEKDLLRWFNYPLDVADASAALTAGFLANEVESQDWRILQRVYETKLLKTAFSQMTGERLGRGEDSYQWFVIASLLKQMKTDNSVIGYRYYMGRGVTNLQNLSLSEFSKLCQEYFDLGVAATQYRDGFQAFSLDSYLRGYREKLLVHVIREWVNRVPEDKKVTAAQIMVKFFGQVPVGTAIMKMARDQAWEIWQQEKPFTTGESFIYWATIPTQLLESDLAVVADRKDFTEKNPETTDKQEYQQYFKEYRSHLHALYNRYFEHHLLPLTESADPQKPIREQLNTNPYPKVFAIELMRSARDHAYRFWVENRSRPANPYYADWAAVAAEWMRKNPPHAVDYDRYATEYSQHTMALKRRWRQQESLLYRFLHRLKHR